MRIASLLGLVAVAILTMGLVAVLAENEQPETIVEALRKPQIRSTTTASDPPTTSATTTATADSVTTAPVVDRGPDVDALGSPVGDLHATTTTVASFESASARAPSASPAPPTTSPRAVSAPTTVPPPTTAPPPPTTVAPATSQGGPNGEFESQFASKINSLRSGSGLAGLSRDGGLDARARSWAEGMANNGGLSHSNLGSLLPPWSAAGENVGMGGSVDAVFGALVGSSGHKSNMLGDYTHLGVGVWVDAGGIVWTAHVFTR